jgi:carotenoid cleavage dioxygenase-like enzyme
VSLSSFQEASVWRKRMMATIKLSTSVPYGFHGTFMGSKDLKERHA